MTPHSAPVSIFNSESYPLIDQQVPVFACALKAASFSECLLSLVVVSYVTIIAGTMISSYVETAAEPVDEPHEKLLQSLSKISLAPKPLSIKAWTAPTTGGFVFEAPGFPKAEIALPTWCPYPTVSGQN